MPERASGSEVNHMDVRYRRFGANNLSHNQNAAEDVRSGSHRKVTDSAVAEPRRSANGDGTPSVVAR
jgi:hypothetical protein